MAEGSTICPYGFVPLFSSAWLPVSQVAAPIGFSPRFIYSCGYSLEPFVSNVKAESVARAFIEGYLRGGGSVAKVNEAGAPKYTRVFSIFTPPPMLLAVADICKKQKKQQRDN